MSIHDPVNNPIHYQAHRNLPGIEIIREFLGDDGFRAYLEGSSLKYIYRHSDKGKPVEDLEKAIWFLSRLKHEIEADEGRNGYGQ